MGDIIQGFFLALLVLVLYGSYRLATRNAPGRRSVIRFISLLVIAGGTIGMVIACFNRSGYAPAIFGLTLLFFMIQAVAGYLYLKRPKAGLPILCFTFLLQIPVIHSGRITYSNQTLLGFNIDDYPGKAFDIEPGSYINFFYGTPGSLGIGINLIPLLAILLFLRYGAKNDA